VTTDQNLPYQQHLEGRRLAILILPTTSWPKLKDRLRDVQAALATLAPGSVLRLPISRR
jgi:hypothetical protein